MEQNSNKLIYFFVLGAIFTAALGVLFHFLYEWSGYHPIIALFCATNESTWEHLKLLFFPFLLWTFISYFWFGKDFCCYLGSSALFVFLGMLSIITLFYTYSGVLGFSIDFLNIALYFFAVILTFYLLYRFLLRQINESTDCSYSGNSTSGLHFNEQEKNTSLCDWIGALFFLVIAVLFFYFTFHAPALGLFVAP